MTSESLALTGLERGSIGTISGIYALRMLGLFMIMPVFALYARETFDAPEYLIGLALGGYGLTQAILQIPCGILSDYYGRKPIIILGLGLFALGSLVAALADNIYLVIVGRLLQGTGAIGSVLMATMADATREQVRSKAMAYLGATIGTSFMLAMILGPVFNQNVGVPGIFWLTFIFALVSIGLALKFIPVATSLILPKIKDLGEGQRGGHWRAVMQAILPQVINGELRKLYFGAFALHAILAALFLVLPILLQNAGFVAAKLWQVYLASLLLAFMLAMAIIHLMERRKSGALWQKLSILMLLFSLSSLFYAEVNVVQQGAAVANCIVLVTCMVLFFTGFCVLEASLPAQAAKNVSIAGRGTALGIYSSAQFLGIFLGGTFGGLVQSGFGVDAVFILCLLLATLWFLISINKIGKFYV